MYDLIEKKKRARELTDTEIRWMIGGFTDGSIPDYQMAAMAMAIRLCGMSASETASLTDAMAKSGDEIDLSAFGDKTVDKHSTGGVGDKTSLIVSPIVSSLGATVAKMSGRGLGHTGGTIDKLESIPGFVTEMGVASLIEQANDIGIALISQSGELALADKKLYALRDVTATVDSIPLIASSIMSKKLACGSRSIVLDVKCGSGALVKTHKEARELALAMIEAGRKNGRRMAALITDMDMPLGTQIGNALEVKEAAELLARPDEADGDLVDVCLALSAQMLSLSLGMDVNEAREAAQDCLASGRAYGTFKKWISTQGGDIRYIEDTSLFGESRYVVPVLAQRDGYIAKMDTEAIGNIAMMLGAGRQRKEDKIDPLAGITVVRKTSDAVKRGDVIAYLHTDRELPDMPLAYNNAVTVSEDAPERREHIIEVLR